MREPEKRKPRFYRARGTLGRPAHRQAFAIQAEITLKCAIGVTEHLMEPAELSIFKYQHAGSAPRSRGRLIFTGISALIALCVTVFAFPFGAISWLVPAIAYSSGPKRLYLGSRYLICGPQIIYFANVEKLVVSSEKGELRLKPRQGKELLIERSKFPTNARKSHKVTANRQAKFTKVAAKLIEKVRAASPDAEMIGVG